MRADIACVAAATLLALACGSDPVSAPPAGRLQVTIETTGGDLDLDGYEVLVDQTRHPWSANGVLTINALAAGQHAVALDGVASNCQVTGGAAQSVVIHQGATATVEFAVVCVATGLEIGISTTGLDPDPHGYDVDISPVPSCDPLSPDCVPAGAPLPPIAQTSPAANSTTSVSRLVAGWYEVRLSSVAPNCTVAGPSSLVVSVTTGSLAPVDFSVSCVATTGVIHVRVTTTGEDQDLDGYTLTVSDGLARPILIDDSFHVSQVDAGSHTVQLGDASSNCADPLGPTRAVQVTAGGLVRDTVSVIFQLQCRRHWALAFSRRIFDGAYSPNQVMLATADGSEVARVGFGAAPSWAPDGQQFVFVAEGCDYYYYYCFSTLYKKSLSTGSSSFGIQLTGSGFERDPAWSPTGGKIAYSQGGANNLLYVVNLDGALVGAVDPPVLWAMEPAWSPDGTRLAFTCASVDGVNSDICVMSVDGSGFVRLTSGLASDGQPSWSPDGTRIAFSTNHFSQTLQRDIAVMDANGANAVKLFPGVEPAWSPDGTRIAFVWEACPPVGCHRIGLFAVNPDGSGLTQLTSDASDSNPAWRP